MSLVRISSETPYNSVRMAEFLRTPSCSFSIADLNIVAAKKMKLIIKRPIGMVSHSQRTEMYVSLLNDCPVIISLLGAERMTFVIAVASLSMCYVTFGASQGLYSS